MICIASAPEKTFREEEVEDEEGEDPAGRLQRGRRGWRTSCRWLPGKVVHSSVFIYSLDVLKAQTGAVIHVVIFVRSDSGDERE